MQYKPRIDKEKELLYQKIIADNESSESVLYALKNSKDLYNTLKAVYPEEVKGLKALKTCKTYNDIMRVDKYREVLYSNEITRDLFFSDKSYKFEWTFNNNLDVTNGSFNLIPTNTAVTLEDSDFFPKAAKFNNSLSSKLGFDADDRLNSWSEITSAAWIKLSSFDYMQILCKHNTGNDGEWYLGIYTNTSKDYVRFKAIIVNDKNVRKDCNSQTNLELNKWYHVAFTYDNQFIRIYLNGVLNNIIRQNGNIKNQPINFIIGNDAGSSWRYNGFMNNVKLYNRALTANEIYKEYADTKALSYDFSELTRTNEPTVNILEGYSLDSLPFNSSTAHGTWSSTPGYKTVDVKVNRINCKGWLIDKDSDGVTWGSNNRNADCSFYSTNSYFLDKNILTASAWFYVTNDCNINNVRFMINLRKADWSNIADINKFYDLAKKGTWQKLTVSVNLDDYPETGVFMFRSISSLLGVETFETLTGHFIGMVLPQIEEKPYATDFTPTNRSIEIVDKSKITYNSIILPESTPTFVHDEQLNTMVMRFNKTGDKVESTENIKITSDDLTFSFWVKRIGNTGVFLKLGTNNSSGFYFQNFDQTSLHVWFFGSNPSQNVYFGNVLSTTEFKFVTITVNYPNKTIRRYINGEFLGETVLANSINKPNDKLIMGDWNFNLNWSGYLYNVNIYPYKLTDHDIQKKYYEELNEHRLK